MGQYQRIFLIADAGMQRTPAFDEAVGLARASGGRLHIGICADDPALASTLTFDAAAGQHAVQIAIDQHKAWLETEIQALRSEGIEVTGDVVWAHPALEEMLAQVLELSPDLVVKSARHESLLKRLLFTPLEWQLLRLCPQPLFLVSGPGPCVPRRIVVAIDPACDGDDASHDAFNNDIIHAGLALAIQCQADLHLAHAMFPPVVDTSTPGAALPLSGDLYLTLLAARQRRFDEFADAHSVPHERRHFLLGSPGREIPALAAEIGADTIVLGSVHRRGIERLLMGSTAEAILQHTPCNVLAVKPSRSAEDFRRWLSEQRLRASRSS